MVIEAPLSRYKKNNILIIIAIFAGLAAWTFYDGYYNKDFIKKHTNPDGTYDSKLMFNKQGPPYLLAGAALVGVYFFYIKNKKIVADDAALNVNRIVIPYKDIAGIDKTYFDKKGFFIVHYSRNGQDRSLKISDRVYDNLPAVLDCLVAKISA